MTHATQAGHAVSNSDEPQRFAMLSDALWSVKLRFILGALVTPKALTSLAQSYAEGVNEFSRELRRRR